MFDASAIRRVMLSGSALMLCLFSMILSPSAASAQAPLADALEEIYADDERGMRLLRDNGVKLGRVLTLERVGSQAYVVEVGIEVAGNRARYPLKVGREDGRWTLLWQPESVYVAALLRILKSDALPDIETTAQWGDVARLPAMPIIATRKRYVTPFGDVPLSDRDDDSPPGDLELSPGLVRAAQWWVKKVLNDDPAPAGVDLLLDTQMSWQDTNKVLFNLSTVGLYQLTIVTRTGGAFQVASPLRQAKFAVVLYPLDKGFGLRIATDAGVLPTDGCAPEMTACLHSPDDLAEVLARHPTPVAPVMVAAAGTVATGDVLRFAAKFARLTKVGPHQLLIGYVQK